MLASWSDVFRVLLGRWVADRGERPTILVRLWSQHSLVKAKPDTCRPVCKRQRSA